MHHDVVEVQQARGLRLAEFGRGPDGAVLATSPSEIRLQFASPVNTIVNRVDPAPSARAR